MPPVEILNRRTKNAKHYLLDDGRGRGVISLGAVHYQAAAGGPWIDKKPNLKSTARVNGFISDESDVTMETYQEGSGGNRKWWIEYRETIGNRGVRFSVLGQPTPVAGTNELQFASPDGVWSYFHTRLGGKMLGPPMASPVGQRTFGPFLYEPLNGAPDLALAADGTLKCGDVFTMGRPHLIGADGLNYAAVNWNHDPAAGTIAFTITDAGLPPSAYPYRVDPSSSFNVAASGDDDRPYISHNTIYPPTGTVTRMLADTTIYPERSWYNPPYQVGPALMRMDSSSIPDEAILDAGTLNAYVTGAGSANALNVTAGYRVWDGSAGDWTNAALVDAHAGTLITSLVLNQYNGLALTNLQNINKTGLTSFALTLSQRAGDAAPTGTNYVHISSFDHTNPEPQLLVDYTIDVTAPPVPTGVTAMLVPE